MGDVRGLGVPDRVPPELRLAPGNRKTDYESPFWPRVVALFFGAPMLGLELAAAFKTGAWGARLFLTALGAPSVYASSPAWAELARWVPEPLYGGVLLVTGAAQMYAAVSPKSSLYHFTHFGLALFHAFTWAVTLILFALAAPASLGWVDAGVMLAIQSWIVVRIGHVPRRARQRRRAGDPPRAP